jgi:hypothetical protein
MLGVGQPPSGEKASRSGLAQDSSGVRIEDVWVIGGCEDPVGSTSGLEPRQVSLCGTPRRRERRRCRFHTNEVADDKLAVCVGGVAEQEAGAEATSRDTQTAVNDREPDDREMILHCVTELEFHAVRV